MKILLILDMTMLIGVTIIIGRMHNFSSITCFGLKSWGTYRTFFTFGILLKLFKNFIIFIPKNRFKFLIFAATRAVKFTGHPVFSLQYLLMRHSVQNVTRCTRDQPGQAAVQSGKGVHANI